MASKISIFGSAQVQPVSPASEETCWPEVKLDDEFTGQHISGSHAVVGTELAPYVITGVDEARLVVLRPLDGAAFVARLTTGEGVARFPVSSLLVLRLPQDDPATLIELIGAGDITYVVAG